MGSCEWRVETHQRSKLSFMKFLALQIVVGNIFEGEGGEREHKKLTWSRFFYSLNY